MNEPTIRELRDSDYEALAAFNAAFPGDNLGAARWLDRFRHWWDNNPAYDSSWKRGFLMESDGTIVGWVGSFPSLFKAGDAVVKAFNGTTWRVLPEYRQWSIDLWGYNRGVSKHYLSFNTTPTEDVAKLILRLRYFRFPWGRDAYSYTIVNAGKFCCFFSPRIPYLGRIWLSKILWGVSRILTKESNVYRVAIMEDDLSGVDNLWERTRSQYVFTNVRDGQSVEWYRQGKLMHGVYNNGILIAYALYLRNIHCGTGQSLLTMVDFWYDRNEHLNSILSSLVRFDYKKSRKENTLVSIRYPHFSKEISKAFSSIFPLYRNNRYSGFLRNPDKSGYRIDDSNAYFTLLQGDFGA